MTRRLPPTASVAEPAGGARLFAPAAHRNAQAICAYLAGLLPAKGTVLEIASGTGQHVAVFAAALPGLHWQPTDIAPERLASIDAHVADASLGNVAPARMLDAARPGWGAAHPPVEAVLIVNLLHLLPAPEVQSVLAEAAEALAPGAHLVIYGPFARDGVLTSPGDQRFDADLRAADPAIGYKDTRDVERWLKDNGLRPAAPVEMPANNLILTAHKDQT